MEKNILTTPITELSDYFKSSTKHLLKMGIMTIEDLFNVGYLKVKYYNLSTVAPKVITALKELNIPTGEYTHCRTGYSENVSHFLNCNAYEVLPERMFSVYKGKSIQNCLSRHEKDIWVLFGITVDGEGNFHFDENKLPQDVLATKKERYDAIPKKYRIYIEDLGLPTSIVRALQSEKMVYLNDVINAFKKRKDIKFSNVGPVGMAKIKAIVNKYSNIETHDIKNMDLPDLLASDISVLPLRAGTKNVLRRNGIETVDQLTNHSFSQLRLKQGIGETNATEIVTVLSKNGLKLSQTTHTEYIKATCDTFIKSLEETPAFKFKADSPTMEKIKSDLKIYAKKISDGISKSKTQDDINELAKYIDLFFNKFQAIVDFKRAQLNETKNYKNKRGVKLKLAQRVTNITKKYHHRDFVLDKDFNNLSEPQL